MKLNEYQKEAMKTMTEKSNNIAYLLTGLNAEVGEVNDKFAKNIRNERLAINHNHCEFTKDDEEAILKELGDVLWFVSMLAFYFDCDLETLAQKNLDKLQDRQKRGVIVGEGDDR